MQFLRVLSASLMLCLLGGCAGYRLGPADGSGAGDKSVQFNPFSNRTLEPRLSDAVMTALRRDLQEDGTYRLATRGSADIVVTGAITHYARHELSFVSGDVLTVQDYLVSITAQVTARETGTGRVLFDRPLTGSTIVRVGSDLTGAERQAMPLLAQDLARKVITLLADGSW
jgi:hypothetical protein